MPKKQPIAKATAAAAPPARTATPRTTRVTSVKHSKAQGAEASAEETAAPVAAPVAKLKENPSEAIAKIAYGYWEARGYTGGSAEEDWIRAEAEYLHT